MTDSTDETPQADGNAMNAEGDEMVADSGRSVNGITQWAWCRSCDWTFARPTVEGVVQERAKADLDDDTDDVAREYAKNHSRVCQHGGDTRIHPELQPKPPS